MRELKEAFRLDILELEEIIPQTELIRFDKKMAIDSDKGVFRIECSKRMSASRDEFGYRYTALLLTIVQENSKLQLKKSNY